MKSVKLFLVGDAGVGKTTYVKRRQTGEFQRKYVPTLGHEVTQLTFETTRGPFVFEVWDIAGSKPGSDTPQVAFSAAECAIVMFDFILASSYRNVGTWYEAVVERCPNLPVVLVGNKVDVLGKKVRDDQVTFHKDKNIPFVRMSTKSNYRVESPFVYLARQVAGDPELEFAPLPFSSPHGPVSTGDTAGAGPVAAVVPDL
jgi:GTP-binding nuclear protein Ran